MVKRRQRHGVSGNPARRAHGSNGASVPSADRPRSRLHAYSLGAALVVVALLVLLVPRPGGDEGPSGATPDVAPPEETAAAAREQVETTGAPRQATDEAFCAAFFALIDEGRRSGEGESRPERLERLADDLLAVGVPAAMSLPARTRYYRVISGAYDSIGLELSPEAVGAAPEPVEGDHAAFTAYLDENCPD